MGIGHGVAALEENEGEMETDGSRARVRCWGRLGRMGLGRLGRPGGEGNGQREWKDGTGA